MENCHSSFSKSKLICARTGKDIWEDRHCSWYYRRSINIQSTDKDVYLSSSSKLDLSNTLWLGYPLLVLHNTWSFCWLCLSLIHKSLGFIHSDRNVSPFPSLILSAITERTKKPKERESTVRQEGLKLNFVFEFKMYKIIFIVFQIHAPELL